MWERAAESNRKGGCLPFSADAMQRNTGGDGLAAAAAGLVVVAATTKADAGHSFLGGGMGY